MELHEKIIAETAKEILVPIGVMRKGQSRFYFDDNGFFAVGIEFQPSGADKGTYLNVGVDFFWSHTPQLDADINFGYSDDVGSRVLLKNGKQFASLSEGEEVFRGKINEFALTAKERVLEYRKFACYEYGHRRFEQRSQRMNYIGWELYDAAMYDFLFGNYKEGKKLFELLLESWSMYKRDWEKEAYSFFIEELSPKLCDKDSAHEAVVEIVRNKRRRLSERNCYKKLSSDFDFPEDRMYKEKNGLLSIFKK